MVSKINASTTENVLKDALVSKVIEHEGKINRFEAVIENISNNMIEIKADIKDIKKDVHRIEIDMIKMEGRIVGGYKKYFWMYVVIFATSLGITHHFELYIKKLLGM